MFLRKNFFEPLRLSYRCSVVDENGIMKDDELLAAAVTPKRAHFLESWCPLSCLTFLDRHCSHGLIFYLAACVRFSSLGRFRTRDSPAQQPQCLQAGIGRSLGAPDSACSLGNVPWSEQLVVIALSVVLTVETIAITSTTRVQNGFLHGYWCNGLISSVDSSSNRRYTLWCDGRHWRVLAEHAFGKKPRSCGCDRPRWSFHCPKTTPRTEGCVSGRFHCFRRFT